MRCRDQIADASVLATVARVLAETPHELDARGRDVLEDMAITTLARLLARRRVLSGLADPIPEVAR